MILYAPHGFIGTREGAARRTRDHPSSGEVVIRCQMQQERPSATKTFVEHVYETYYHV